MVNNFFSSASSVYTASDRDLLTAIRKGDVLAFHELYGRYSSNLREYVTKEVNSYAGADDLVLRVFIDIWKRAVSFEGAEHPTVQSWMYSLARASCDRSSRTAGGRATGFVRGM